MLINRVGRKRHAHASRRTLPLNSSVRRLQNRGSYRMHRLLWTFFLLLLIPIACSSPNDDFRKATQLLHDKNYGDGVPLLINCAGRGHGGCAQALGSLYYRGEGVKQDYAKAALWEEHAYKTGTRYGFAGTYAANALGIQYREGKGVPKDFEKARLWFKRAYALCSSPDLQQPGLNMDCSPFNENIKTVKAF
jgi:TPR repeat protein